MPPHVSSRPATGAEVILDIDDHKSRVHTEIASGIVDGALDGRSLVCMIGHRLWMAKKPFADGRTDCVRFKASRSRDCGGRGDPETLQAGVAERAGGSGRRIGCLRRGGL